MVIKYLIEHVDSDDKISDLLVYINTNFNANTISLFDSDRNVIYNINKDRNLSVDITSLIMEDIVSNNSDEIRNCGIKTNFKIDNIIIKKIQNHDKLLGILCITNVTKKYIESIDIIKPFIYLIKNILVNQLLHKDYTTLEKIYTSGLTNHIFLENISHNLRTPANGIIGYNQLLLSMEHIIPKDPYKYILQINQCSINLIRIINDLLDFSKLSTGHVFVNNIYFNIKVMFQEINGMVKTQITNKEQNISFYIDNNIPEFIISDKQKIIQILINLISNSNKFTNNYGNINISCTKILDDYIEFKVKDDGIGITNDELYKIFNTYIQLENSKFKEGTGLGLFISKKLTELLNGNINIESVLNEGTTVTFTVKYNKDNLLSISSLKNKNILLIVSTTTDLLKQYLTDWNINVVICKSFIEASRIFFTKRQIFDLCIIEIYNEYGIDLSKQMKKEYPQFPIISISKQNIALLFDYNLSLPLDKSYLLNCILTIINNQKTIIHAK